MPSSAVFAVGYALAVEVVSIGAMLLFGRDFSFTTDLFAICAAGILACALWALLGAGVALLTGSSMAGALSVILWFVFGEWIVRAVLLAMDLGGIGAALPVSATIGTIVNAAPSIDVDAFASLAERPDDAGSLGGSVLRARLATDQDPRHHLKSCLGRVYRGSR